MSRVLVIESSARQEGSVSRQLTQAFVAQWKQANPADSIQVRDLAKQPLPHLDMDLLGGWMKPADQQSAAEQAAAQRSDALVAEAWLDHVLRAGVTFQYTANGPQGLLTGKRAYVLTARGGIYSGSPLDHQEPYLRQALGFIGITDVEFIHAEGLNMGGDTAAKGLESAQAKVAAIA